ncbi:DUF1311 domain-containing protein [Aquitalea palustris]|uniref:DUF1311 domain-containing protein n=1 Tax=Aquitalea palustris TaxID=2480983 RepID=A0A454JLI9_9NEIS|nr:lysozyme inhibitor LprI family protein [Aquitalea palustris]RMD00698.1 DUF1311 domain-containing protein [Aquitalea palustris]
MKTCLSLILLALSASALANSACDKPKNDFDGLYCLNKVYSQADKDLNESYGELAKMLDAEGKKQLKSGQLSWIRQRNADCSYSDQRGFFVNLDCATRTTIDRLQFINDRKRECKSAGCMNSKLQ